jgi:NDP-sugar pyrophosphorylase family protein
MGSLTATTPKPLLCVNGQPIIEYILTGLCAAGLSKVVIVTGYRGEQIETRLDDGARLGVHIVYRHQDIAAGTARALLLARDLVADGAFLVSWGDILVDPTEYVGLLAEFRRAPCDAMLTVNAVDDPWRGAAVYVDREWRVTQLIEKPPPGASRTPWNNAGIFVLTPRIFTYADRLPPSPRGEYELPQALAAMVADGRVVRAHPLRGFWSDLGTPDDLAAAERTFRPARR